jgi:hypothetical protein
MLKVVIKYGLRRGFVEVRYTDSTSTSAVIKRTLKNQVIKKY